MQKLFLFTFLFISTFTFGQKEDQNNFFLAETYYRQGEHEKATQIYKKLYDKSPFNTSYLNRLISCYQETDKFKIAEDLLKIKIQKNPNQTYLNVFLGYNYERQQLKKQAKIYYDKAINSLDKNDSYGAIIGRLFKEYNLLDNAILAYQKTM